jgi:hypothetical protein
MFAFRRGHGTDFFVGCWWAGVVGPGNTRTRVYI